MKYIEKESKTALNKLKRKIPYGWDLNIYRGCEHECKYCYAIYSHKYLDSKDFFGTIYIKKDIDKILDKELSKKTWKKEIINIGGVTDSYQQIEEKTGLMQKVLKVMLKHKNPIIISTKSDLILRDYDLIKELAEHTYVNVATTVTTMNEDDRKKIESGSVTSKQRLKVLKKFSDTKCSRGLHVMPIIPLITDNKENFDEMFKLANEAQITYVLTGTLYLRGATRPLFLKFIEEQYSDIFKDFKKLYKTGGAPKEYKDKLYPMIKTLKEKYKLSSSYMKPIKERLS